MQLDAKEASYVIFSMCLNLLEMPGCDFYLKRVSLSLSSILSLWHYFTFYFSVWGYTFDLVHFGILCCYLRVTQANSEFRMNRTLLALNSETGKPTFKLQQRAGAFLHILPWRKPSPRGRTKKDRGRKPNSPSYNGIGPTSVQRLFEVSSLIQLQWPWNRHMSFGGTNLQAMATWILPCCAFSATLAFTGGVVQDSWGHFLTLGCEQPLLFPYSCHGIWPGSLTPVPFSHP